MRKYRGKPVEKDTGGTREKNTGGPVKEIPGITREKDTGGARKKEERPKVT